LAGEFRGWISTSAGGSSPVHLIWSSTCLVFGHTVVRLVICTCEPPNLLDQPKGGFAGLTIRQKLCVGRVRVSYSTRCDKFPALSLDLRKQCLALTRIFIFGHLRSWFIVHSPCLSRLYHIGNTRFLTSPPVPQTRL
jgi:hypothetical protein